MNLAEILKSDKNKSSKRLGRGMGSGKGKTCGRGHKGQKSRSGSKTKAGFEGGQMPLYRRLPKRGFVSVTKKEYEIINIDALNIFDKDTTVGPHELLEKKLIKNKDASIKILGNGELSKTVTVKAHKFSKTAIEKIEAQKGKVEIIKEGKKKE